jgi:hypothetical protein
VGLPRCWAVDASGDGELLLNYEDEGLVVGQLVKGGMVSCACNADRHNIGTCHLDVARPCSSVPHAQSYY